MIKIDPSTDSLDEFRAQLAADLPCPGAEAFHLEGTRTRVSCESSPTASSGISPHLPLRFRPADPDLRLPDRTGRFSEAERDNILCLLASPDGRFGSLRINADVRLYTCKLGDGHRITFHPRPDHHLRLLPSSGQLDVLGQTIASGDVASLSDEKEVILTALSDSEFLMLELG